MPKVTRTRMAMARLPSKESSPSSDDVLPLSTDAILLAQSTQWRLVNDNEKLSIRSVKHRAMQDIMDIGDLPKFDTNGHKQLLKYAGYSKVTNQHVLQY